MLHSLFTKTLRDERRALMWWAIGVASLSSWTTGWYRTYAKSAAEMAKFFERAPAALKALFGGSLDLGTAVGYLRMEMFSLMAPLLLMIFAIGAGVRAIAGEERAGTLDMLVSTPISRRRIVVEKFASMVASTAAVASALAAALCVGALITSMDVSLVNIVAATTAAAMLAVFVGALALTVGAATGRRGTSIGIATTVAIAGYLVYGLSDSVTALKPWRWAAPFTYYAEADVLSNGINFWHLGVLAGLAVLLCGVAVITFERRDIKS